MTIHYGSFGPWQFTAIPDNLHFELSSVIHANMQARQALRNAILRERNCFQKPEEKIYNLGSIFKLYSLPMEYMNSNKPKYSCRHYLKNWRTIIKEEIRGI